MQKKTIDNMLSDLKEMTAEYDQPSPNFIPFYTYCFCVCTVALKHSTTCLLPYYIVDDVSM